MEWKISDRPVDYADALSFMEDRVAAIREGNADELVWLLEHPPLYTAGTSAKAADLLNPQFPVYDTGRGGQHTYHGPGQRVAYVMLDLRKDGQAPDLKKYICNLEEWIIRSIAPFGIKGERRSGRVGIWVETPQGEKKIAAVGVRVRHWITFHGISINVDPDLSHFGGIVPCGLSEFGVTSFADLKKTARIEDLDRSLLSEFSSVFKRSCACADDDPGRSRA